MNRRQKAVTWSWQKGLALWMVWLKRPFSRVANRTKPSLPWKPLNFDSLEDYAQWLPDHVEWISDPLGVEMSWSPKTEDSSPWLDIVLPQPAPVKQVKLYTPDGNLIAGRILAGEQTCEFTDNTDNVITVALDGTVIESFKLEIIRQKDRKPWTGGISNRLLTEVEAY